MGNHLEGFWGGGFGRNVKRIGRCADYTSFVEFDLKKKKLNDGRSWVGGWFSIITILGTLAWITFLYTQPIYSPTVALCICSLFKDEIEFFQIQSDGSRSSLGTNLASLVPGLNGTVLALVSSYVLSQPCPYHNSGSVCSNQCLDELVLKDDITKQLLNPTVGLRACPDAAQAVQQFGGTVNDYVTCFLDLSPCAKVSGVVQGLLILGSTWGWVSLGLLLAVIVSNTTCSAYAKRRHFRDKMQIALEAQNKKIEEEIETKIVEVKEDHDELEENVEELKEEVRELKEYKDKEN